MGVDDRLSRLENAVFGRKDDEDLNQQFEESFASNNSHAQDVLEDKTRNKRPHVVANSKSNKPKKRYQAFANSNNQRKRPSPDVRYFLSVIIIDFVF